MHKATSELAANGSVPAKRSSGGWPDGATKGTPAKGLRNTMAAITRLGLECRRDMFRNRNIINGHKLDSLAGNLTDDAEAITRAMIAEQFRFDPGKDMVHEAIQTLCIRSRFHPILDYLDGLSWDGEPRVEGMLMTYLGAKDTPLNRTTATIMMVAAVRRVRQPGCKFDMIVVLEGEQGTGKSTAVMTLAGPENFSDQEILTADAKTQMEQLEGKWLYEIAELSGMSTADIERVKAFASRTEDRARLAYARNRTDRPRQTILIGTTNNDKYLRDQTGNRRFLPVKTGRIDLDALRRDRDQLWAEAATMEAAGESIDLRKELWAAAAIEQEARMVEDPWMEILARISVESEGGYDRVFNRTVWMHLEVDAKFLTRAMADRAYAVMRRLGWEGPDQLRIRGKRDRGFRRAVARAGEAETASEDDDSPIG
jgi:predicted P-loop ATPase